MMQIFSGAKRVGSVTRNLWLMFLVGALGGPMEVPEGRADDLTNATPFEQFKQFLVSPPIVKSLCFEKISPGNRDTHELPTNGMSGQIRFFHARWQPGFLFLRSGPSLELVQNSELRGAFTIGRRGDEYWQKDEAGMLTYWNDAVTELSQIHQPPSLIFHHRADDFNAVAQMGIMHLHLGSVKWSGDMLTGTGFIPDAHLASSVKGTLKSGDNGFAAELDLQYHNGDRDYHYLERYSYTTNTGISFLPDKIESILILPGKQLKVVEWRIISIETNAVGLPDSLFGPPGAQPPNNNARSLHFSNDAWYAKNLLGQMVPVRDGSTINASVAAVESAGNHFLYYGAVALSTVAAFSLARRMNKNKITSTTTKGMT